MPSTNVTRNLRFLVAAPLVVSVIATLALAQVASAADAAPVTLASASDGRTLKLGDLAADDLFIVGFQRKNVSYVRWSKNGGTTFASRVALHSGLPSTDPRVATCNDSVFAVSTWRTTTRQVGVYYRNFVTGDNGTYSLGAGEMGDIACFGDVAATTWVHDDHLWLSAQASDCGNPCADGVTIDLGTGDFSSPPRITGDYAGFTVAWLTTGLAIQHFDYDSSTGGSFTLTPGPVVTLMDGRGVTAPVIAASSERVVVGYQRAGRANIRISDDVASSFGPRIIVPGQCSNCAGGGPQPSSVSVSGSNILVEVTKASGSPASYAMNGFVTRDSGDTWVRVSSRKGGSQTGILIEGVAEVWDHQFAGTPNQFVRFQHSVL